MAGDAAMQDGRLATPRSTLVECGQQACVTLGGGKYNVQGQRFAQERDRLGVPVNGEFAVVGSILRLH